ncbi:S26 family signal peptidase [Vibrio alginolyticus]|uniref:S26 family signal peptidase n=1 Tax=Vibrio diabolicus TaxID=50719 RepID=UPI00193E413A|nr:S26 family signal peptidase [Vibrio diabolicus]EGQ8101728.1 hypothetical protein [Vibrio parahaemolyticus]EHA1078757.1 hypothetical protein [Vibrio alginolyticus]EGQ8547912.1 hypothetical protein [Vibrio parahaemolyticus]EGR3042439.1 hypothetical protein [Vibrio parahaemolyticus]EHA1137197.1 hypothetical protein [Vibrio alginolyticus]
MNWSFGAMKKQLPLLLILTVCAVSFDFLFSRLTINITESNPYSLFWIGGTTFKKGGYVMFELENSKLTKPLVKAVGCISGDTLQSRGIHFYCNGESLAMATIDNNDNPDLIPATFNGEIPEGYFFALGTHPLSYDSRYFGLVPVKNTQPVIPIF